MTSERVPVAPNQARIRAKVLRVEQSPDFSDKWLFELQIIESQAVYGGNFARVGQNAKGFTITPTCTLSGGEIITAQAQFLGDMRGGRFQLVDIRIENQ
jgi:hypothetical protein